MSGSCVQPELKLALSSNGGTDMLVSLWPCNSPTMVDIGPASMSRTQHRVQATWNGRTVWTTREDHPRFAATSVVDGTSRWFVTPGHDFYPGQLVDIEEPSGTLIRKACKVSSSTVADNVYLSGGSGLWPVHGSIVKLVRRSFIGINLGGLEAYVAGHYHTLTLAFAGALTAYPGREYLFSKGSLSSKAPYLCAIQRVLNPNRIRVLLHYNNGAQLIVEVPQADLPLNTGFAVTSAFSPGLGYVKLELATSKTTVSNQAPWTAPLPLPDQNLVLGGRGNQESFQSGYLLGFKAERGLVNADQWRLDAAANKFTSYFVPTPRVVASHSEWLLGNGAPTPMPPSSTYWARPWPMAGGGYVWYWSSDHGGALNDSGIYRGYSDSPLAFPTEVERINYSAETPYLWNGRLLAHEVTSWASFPQWQQATMEAPQITYWYDLSGTRLGVAVPFAACNVPMEFDHYTHTGYTNVAPPIPSGEQLAFGSGMSGTDFGAVRSVYDATLDQFIINPDEAQLNAFETYLNGDTCEWWQNIIEYQGRYFGIGRGRVGEYGRPYAAFITELDPHDRLRPTLSYAILSDEVGNIGPPNPNINTPNYTQDFRAYLEGGTLYVYQLEGYAKTIGTARLRVLTYSMADILSIFN